MPLERTIPKKVERHLVSLVEPTSFEVEQYRLLRNQVERICPRGGCSIFAVTSPGVGDGKTTTAINLAGAMAQTPQVRVLLVDADLRVPSVMDYLGIGPSDDPGLVDLILDSGLTLEKAVKHFPVFNLSVLPAGRPQVAPYELLKTPRTGDLLQEARRQYNYIILDTPPLIPVPDCQVIANWVDRFLLVVAAHRTPRKMVEEALNIMDPEKTGGLIFNGDDRPLHRYYGYYYYGRFHNQDRTRWWRRWTRKGSGRDRVQHPSGIRIR